MTEFTKKRFSVSAPLTEAYADNYERTFGKKEGGTPRGPELNQELAPVLAHAAPVAPVSRAEYAKWLKALEDYRGLSVQRLMFPADVRQLDMVIESLKLVLYACDQEKP